jgi:hypothetical protein
MDGPNGAFEAVLTLSFDRQKNRQTKSTPAHAGLFLRHTVTLKSKSLNIFYIDLSKIHKPNQMGLKFIYSPTKRYLTIDTKEQ